MIEINYHHSTYKTRMGVAILRLIKLIMNIYIWQTKECSRTKKVKKRVRNVKEYKDSTEIKEYIKVYLEYLRV